MPFDVEFTIQPANLHLRKVSLPLSNCLTLNSQIETEWHSIWSGGKPTFPTCEFPLLEWYPRSISISSLRWSEELESDNRKQSCADDAADERRDNRNPRVAPVGFSLTGDWQQGVRETR